MSDLIFGSVLTGTAGGFSLGPFLACTAASLVLGIVAALAYMYKNTYSKGFAVTLALLPTVVQVVILLVNGNLGTGVAVMGAFSLVRFRSVPGSARDIGGIFLAMAVGLATGTGYIGIAAATTVIVSAATLLLTRSRFGARSPAQRSLHITIPEQLDYNEVFEDVFIHFLKHWELTQVRTCNLGSLYKLSYDVTLKDAAHEKYFIDELRCHNGNLEISCGRLSASKEEL